MAEYLIIAVLVAIIVIVAVRKFGGGVRRQVGTATDIVGSVGDNDVPSIDASTEGSSAARTKQDDTSGFRDSDGGRGAGGGTRGGRGAGGGESLTVDGVGSEGYRPVESIKLEWWIIAVIGAVVVAIGLALLFYLRSRTKGPKDKKKKGLWDKIRVKAKAESS